MNPTCSLLGCLALAAIVVAAGWAMLGALRWYRRALAARGVGPGIGRRVDPAEGGRPMGAEVGKRATATVGELIDEYEASLEALDGAKGYEAKAPLLRRSCAVRERLAGALRACKGAVLHRGRAYSAGLSIAGWSVDSMAIEPVAASEMMLPMEAGS